MTNRILKSRMHEEGKYKYVGILAAILVTGGALLTGSVEVLTSEGQPWCSLPDLPSVRSRHTQASLFKSLSSSGNFLFPPRTGWWPVGAKNLRTIRTA